MRSFVLILMLILTGLTAACNRSTDIPDAEEKLLKIFLKERDTLEIYQDQSYVAYMEHQIAQFKKKQKKMSKLILQINKNFKAISPRKQEGYQKDWQRKFQPVVDEIYTLTQQLIVKQTTELTPEIMARIQELSIRMTDLEHHAPDTKLDPIFFTSPVVEELPPSKAGNAPDKPVENPAHKPDATHAPH